MTDVAKKRLLIGGIVLLAAGAAYLYYIKNKGKPADNALSESDPNKPGGEKQPDVAGKPTGQHTTVISGNKPKVVVPKKTAPSLGFGKQPVIKVQTAKASIVGANRLLDDNINNANAKAIYALQDGAPIYSMDSKKAGETKKAQYLGVASYAKSSANGGYVIYFLGVGNVKYFIYSDYVGVKVN